MPSPSWPAHGHFTMMPSGSIADALPVDLRHPEHAESGFTISGCRLHTTSSAATAYALPREEDGARSPTLSNWDYCVPERGTSCGLGDGGWSICLPQPARPWLRQGTEVCWVVMADLDGNDEFCVLKPCRPQEAGIH